MRTAKINNEGIGLGLNIVKQIVDTQNNLGQNQISFQNKFASSITTQQTIAEEFKHQIKSIRNGKLQRPDGQDYSKFHSQKQDEHKT